MHAAKLIEQLKRCNPQAQCSGLGGDRMEAAGCRLHQHIRNMAFMGFVAVLKNLKQIRRNFRIAEQALLSDQPDALILIDYPSFNLRMAEFCRKHLSKTKIYYYIPPKIWAWKRRRIHAISRLCDEVLGIFPFEPAFYAKYGYRCTYVGNPTAEEMALHKSQIPNQKSTIKNQQSHIAILPGSRPSEISHCLTKMLEAARRFPNYGIVVCAAPGIDDAFYTGYLREGESLTRDTYCTVMTARAAIVNSGTATLETALLGCPQVAVYHLALSWAINILRWMQPLFFSVRYFTLVNIIAGKEVIKECIANEFKVDLVSAELGRLLEDEEYRKKMLAEYEHINSLLGTQPAAERAAQIITSKP